MEASAKRDRLRDTLRELESCVIAYSGGTDSVLLASVAREVLGEKAVPVIGISPAIPDYEVEAAIQTAREHIGCEPERITTDELANPDYVSNPPHRCYACKNTLFAKLGEIARMRGIRWVVDGSNADDRHDYRPGLKAAADLGVRSPLAEAGLTKEEIRAWSHERRLPTWDKPAYPCLASRIPYGDPITAEKLNRIGRAEQVLRAQGLRLCRVRYHGDVARIEVPPESFDRVLAVRGEIAESLRAIGFRYIALDLDGFRSGSLNAALTQRLNPSLNDTPS